MMIQDTKNKIREFSEKIIYLGIDNTTPLLEIQRTKLINSIMLVAFLIQIVLIAQSLVMGEWDTILIGIIFLVINTLPLYFNSLGRINTSAWVFCLFAPIIFAIIIVLFGKEIANEYSFLVFTVHLVIFFRKFWERIIYALFLIIVLGFSYYYSVNYDSPFAREFNLFERNAVFVVVVAFVIFVLKIYIDLTDETLNKINVLLDEQKQVNEELNEKSDTIERQNKELQLANEELEKFAYIASHDLKSPLRNVNSFLTLIERKIKQGRTDIVEDIQYATRASTQMYHLIEDILRFSRMKQQEMSFQKVAINDLVVQVMLNLEKTIKDKSAEVILELLPDIECNESQMSLLFQNLFENAIKYNNNPKPTIEVSSQIIGEQVLISIKDNGIGIPMDYQTKVFEMFARLHNQETYEGTGLGLAICKRIVSAHQGDIWFKSDGEYGTTFYIQLPTRQSQ